MVRSGSGLIILILLINVRIIICIVTHHFLTLRALGFTRDPCNKRWHLWDHWEELIQAAEGNKQVQRQVNTRRQRVVSRVERSIARSMARSNTLGPDTGHKWKWSGRYNEDQPAEIADVLYMTMHLWSLGSVYLTTQPQLTDGFLHVNVVN